MNLAVAQENQPIEEQKSQNKKCSNSDFYLADPKSIPYEYQKIINDHHQKVSKANAEVTLLTQQRNETASIANMYMQSGTTLGIEAAMKMRESIKNYDRELLKIKNDIDSLSQKITGQRVFIEGMQGIQDVYMARDPRRLSSVLTLILGIETGFQPRTDCKYNLIIKGVRTREGMEPDEIKNYALPIIRAAK